MDGFSSAGCGGVGGGGVPGGMVGVEITQDESITLGLEERVQLRSEAGRTGGGGRDIDIEDVQWTLVDECGDGKVLSGGVVGEQVVRR